MAVERSGAGDPSRTIVLLWRWSPTHTRGRKPSLTIDRIVQAATAVADREGLAEMSMARVAAELGVGTMSLYTYVPAKAELIDLMVDMAFQSRDLTTDADDWRARIQLFADRTLEMHRRHPWLRQVSLVRPPLGPGLLAQQEYLFAALRLTPLSPIEITTATAAIVTFVDAAAVALVENEQAAPPVDDYWEELKSFWEDTFDVERYPTMTQLWEEGGFNRSTSDTATDAFTFGLRRMLDGIEGLIGGG